VPIEKIGTLPYNPEVIREGGAPVFTRFIPLLPDTQRPGHLLKSRVYLPSGFSQNREWSLYEGHRKNRSGGNDLSLAPVSPS